MPYMDSYLEDELQEKGLVALRCVILIKEVRKSIDKNERAITSYAEAIDLLDKEDNLNGIEKLLLKVEKLVLENCQLSIESIKNIRKAVECTNSYCKADRTLKAAKKK